MKLKLFLKCLIVLAIVVASFAFSIFLRGCEQARGAEMRQELRILAIEFNEAGKELTQIGARVSNIEIAFLEEIEKVKSIYLSPEEKEVCRDEINILFNNLMLGEPRLESAVVKMKNALNKVMVFKVNPDEKEIKEKIVALGNGMISKAKDEINKIEKYDAEFMPF